MVCHHTKTTDFIQGRVVQLNFTARTTGEFPKKKKDKEGESEKSLEPKAEKAQY